MAAALISAVHYSHAQTQTFTSNGTFTVPAGVTSIIVECWGAGGGGSTITANGRRGGGGGGGAYALSIVPVSPGNSFSVLVGIGGSASTQGGSSSFNTNTVVAAGGSGGINNSSTGGAGGSTSGSIGDVTYPGGDGADGDDSWSYSGAGGGGAGSIGAGGDASGRYMGEGTEINGGDGGAGVSGKNNGNNGNTYGGGGSGACTNSVADRNGGPGANGLVVISWPTPYYSSVSGNPATLSNWNSLPGGGGTAPTSFTANNQTFIIQTGHTMTTSGAGWTMSGYNSKVEIQNGGILTENSQVTIGSTSGLQINTGGTLNHNVNSLSIFGGTEMFASGSTINYGLPGTQTVLQETYGNLTISGSGIKTLAGNATVTGSLTLTSGTLAVAGNTLTLNGPAIAGTPNNLSTTSSSTLIFGGSSTGITVPSSVTALSNLKVSNPNGVSLSGPLSSATLTFTDGILNTGSTSLLTITNAAPGSIGGASETSYINGPVARALYAGQTNYGTPYIFPVGNGSEYRPLELLNATTGASSPVMLVSVSSAGAISGDETTITDMAPRNWYLGTVSGNFTSALIRLTEAGLDVINVIGRSSAQSGNYVSAGGANIGSTITNSSPVAGSVLPSYFAIGKTVINTFYSYQSGDWNSTGTWTKDPSGSLWIGAGIPTYKDNVVILNGRTVSINQNGKSSLSLEIRMGGILDLKTFTGHNFGTASGEGTLRLSSGTFPGGDYSDFVSATGGTVEYYNLTGTGLRIC
ncbi:MAG: glycine-rich domain-containing protein [Bacteroidales bacterium]